jgi:hypothetical protein
MAASPDVLVTGNPATDMPSANDLPLSTNTEIGLSLDPNENAFIKFIKVLFSYCFFGTMSLV